MYILFIDSAACVLSFDHSTPLQLKWTIHFVSVVTKEDDIRSISQDWNGQDTLWGQRPFSSRSAKQPLQPLHEDIAEAFCLRRSCIASLVVPSLSHKLTTDWLVGFCRRKWKKKLPWWIIRCMFSLLCGSISGRCDPIWSQEQEQKIKKEGCASAANRQRPGRGQPTALTLTPSLPQPVKFPGWKMDGRPYKRYIFRSRDTSKTSTFNAMRFHERLSTCQCEKEDKRA